MTTKELIQIEEFCTYYKIEYSFLENLNNIGLIEFEIVEQNKYIRAEIINKIEKMIRLHQELNVNVEGIDVIFNLLQRETLLKKQIASLQNKLRLYEDDFSKINELNNQSKSND